MQLITFHCTAIRSLKNIDSTHGGRISPLLFSGIAQREDTLQKIFEAHCSALKRRFVCLEKANIRRRFTCQHLRKHYNAINRTSALRSLTDQWCITDARIKATGRLLQEC